MKHNPAKTTDPTPEFDIFVTRYGNVGVFRRYPDGRIRFWTYERTIEQAIQNFRHWPVRIVTQGNSPFDPETV